MVEGAALEKQCTGNCIEGSNPSLSATYMRLLIYGFEPFGKSTSNISQEVINSLPIRDDIAKTILQVNFKSSVITDVVRESNPDYILGLGQYSSSEKIRIERLARNEWASKSEPSRYIVKDGPKSATVTLELKSNGNSLVSHNAGRYFCNYSMYILLTNPKTKGIPFAFLHIPKSFDLDSAISFVETIIEEILA